MKAPAALPRLPVIAGAASWLLAAGAFFASVRLDQRLTAAGRDDLASQPGETVGYGAAIISALVVGASLAIRRPRNPVGWLFIALGTIVALSGLADQYAAYGVLARPGSLPAASAVAAFCDGSFIPWLVIISLILLLTPTGRPPSPRWNFVVWVALASGTVCMFAVLMTPHPQHPPFQPVDNPLAVLPRGIPWATVRSISVLPLMASVVTAAVSLLLRFRSAARADRRQLRWLALAAIPVALLLLGTWIASATDHRGALSILAILLVGLLPVAAAVAIERDHLYDVDRLLSRTLTYLLLSGIVIGVYVASVVAIGTTAGNVAGQRELAAVVGTLAGISCAGWARGRIQRSLDRRFNRREFDALAAVRRYVREPAADGSIERALREALADPQLTVAYWIEDRGLWVTGAGATVTPAPGAFEVQLSGAPVARISSGNEGSPSHLFAAVIAEARPELENERLRAAIALQLVEVRESRSRIVEAQLAERERIERDLHDGAQQRLLALALQLRAAEVSGDSDRARTALGTAVAELQVAVRELRDLANGLQPSVLADGGLAAALDDLARRTPVPVRIQATATRYPAATEAAAWFIACEAVTNAVKHATPTSIEVTARENCGRLHLAIEDDGCGGADAAGNGLRGITDRAEAAGGTLSVASSPGHGTVVTAVLPCV